MVRNPLTTLVSGFSEDDWRFLVALRICWECPDIDANEPRLLCRALLATADKISLSDGKKNTTLPSVGVFTEPNEFPEDEGSTFLKVILGSKSRERERRSLFRFKSVSPSNDAFSAMFAMSVRPQGI